MAFAIGYNVHQANDLMDKIASAYKNLGIYTREQWNSVANVLQENWVGEDEQSFEKNLATRICTLYVNASSLTENCLNTIAGLAQSWYDFQQRNTLDGSMAEGKGRFKIDVPRVDKNEQIIKPRIRTIGNSDDRGLKDNSSKTAIQEAVVSFVGEIKKKTEGLFQEIDANQAFFGEQTSSIKAYVEQVGRAIAEVTIAIKDMNDALDALAGTSYIGATNDIKEQFTQASSNVDASLNDLGSSRWS